MFDKTELPQFDMRVTSEFKYNTELELIQSAYLIKGIFTNGISQNQITEMKLLTELSDKKP